MTHCSLVCNDDKQSMVSASYVKFDVKLYRLFVICRMIVKVVLSDDIAD